MNKFLALILLIVYSSCINSNKATTTSEDLNLDSDSIKNSIQTKEEDEDNGYVFLFFRNSDSNMIWVETSNDETPILNLTSISEQEYLSKYKSIPTNRLVKEDEVCFTFMVKDSTWILKKEPIGDKKANCSWSQYIAYYPSLQMQAVRSCILSGDLHQFGNIFMINEQTGKTYFISSNADFCDGTPTFSPDLKYMIIEDNISGDDGYMYFLKIYKVKKDENNFDLDIVYVSNSYEFPAEQISWASNNEILTKNLLSQENKIYSYNKLIVPN